MKPPEVGPWAVRAVLRRLCRHGAGLEFDIEEMSWAVRHPDRFGAPTLYPIPVGGLTVDIVAEMVLGIHARAIPGVTPAARPRS